MANKHFSFADFNFFNEDSVVTPDKIYGKSETKIRTLIVTFSYDLIEELKAKNLIAPVSPVIIKSVSGPFPLFKIVGSTIGVFLTHPGAPYCVMALEEICSVYGTKKIISFGSCGLIDRIQTTNIIIPSKVYKFDGVSNYYDSSFKEHLILDHADDIVEIFNDHGVESSKAIVGSVDCIYRETKTFLDYCRDRLVRVIDMEIAGIQAFCQYHHITYMPFLYRADVITDDDYDPKDLVKFNKEKLQQYFSYALLLAEEL